MVPRAGSQTCLPPTLLPQSARIIAIIGGLEDIGLGPAHKPLRPTRAPLPNSLIASPLFHYSRLTNQWTGWGGVEVRKTGKRVYRVSDEVRAGPGARTGQERALYLYLRCSSLSGSSSRGFSIPAIHPSDSISRPCSSLDPVHPHQRLEQQYQHHWHLTGQASVSSSPWLEETATKGHCPHPWKGHCPFHIYL